MLDKSTDHNFDIIAVWENMHNGKRFHLRRDGKGYFSEAPHEKLTCCTKPKHITTFEDCIDWCNKNDYLRLQSVE